MIPPIHNSERSIHDVSRKTAPRLFCSPSLRTTHSARRTAFTLIELLVVVAIISLLVSILLPSLNKAKALARDTLCMTKLRGMGSSWLMYAEDNDGTLMLTFHGWTHGNWGMQPGETLETTWWVHLIDPYIDADWNGRYDRTNEFFSRWFCPSTGPIEESKANPDRSAWYGMNRALEKPTAHPNANRDPMPQLDDFSRAALSVVFCDTTGTITQHFTGSNNYTYRHGNNQQSHYAFVDNHVERADSRSVVDVDGTPLVDDGFPPEEFVWDYELDETGYPTYDYDVYDP